MDNDQLCYLVTRDISLNLKCDSCLAPHFSLHSQRHVHWKANLTPTLPTNPIVTGPDASLVEVEPES